jgi:hypothetical protein
VNADRRQPVARYVLFADAADYDRFAELAEAGYQDLARLDQWSGKAMVTLSAPETVTTRRGLLRRSVEQELPPETATVTGALAAAGEAGREVPNAITNLAGCEAERKLADTMGRVIIELVRDLGKVSHGDQRLHPAYRQTLRLAAELQGLHAMLAADGCRDPFGCVRPRPPEQWGRRAEDVEIAEVRAVLLELAAAAD